MASEQVIPLDALLDPISDDSAVGVDIREDDSPNSEYYAAREARSAARAAERSNIFDNRNADAEAHWEKILELAPEILQNRSKDLEIASWYIEALTRSYGFQGLRDGFQLLLGLSQRYWEDLYPLPDEDGIETRVAPLVGLNGEGAEGVLIAPLRNIGLTQGSDPGPFSLWKYQQALDIDKTMDEEARQQMGARLGFGMADVERAVSESSEEFYIDLVDDLEAAIDTYRAIGQLLDQQCGADSPPTANIVNTLQECLGAARHLGRHKLPQPAIEAAPADGETPSAGAAQGTTTLTSRDEAFRKLAEISVFFRNTEPHSPISYILERAVKWGDLPLDELIRELIPDASARNFYGSLTGIRTDDD